MRNIQSKKKSSNKKKLKAIIIKTGQQSNPDATLVNTIAPESPHKIIQSAKYKFLAPQNSNQSLNPFLGHKNSATKPDDETKSKMTPKLGTLYKNIEGMSFRRFSQQVHVKNPSGVKLEKGFTRINAIRRALVNHRTRSHSMLHRKSLDKQNIDLSPNGYNEKYDFRKACDLYTNHEIAKIDYPSRSSNNFAGKATHVKNNTLSSNFIWDPENAQLADEVSPQKNNVKDKVNLVFGLSSLKNQGQDKFGQYYYHNRSKCPKNIDLKLGKFGERLSYGPLTPKIDVIQKRKEDERNIQIKRATSTMNIRSSVNNNERCSATSKNDRCSRTNFKNPSINVSQEDLTTALNSTNKGGFMTSANLKPSNTKKEDLRNYVQNNFIGLKNSNTFGSSYKPDKNYMFNKTDNFGYSRKKSSCEDSIVDENYFKLLKKYRRKSFQVDQEKQNQALKRSYHYIDHYDKSKNNIINNERKILDIDDNSYTNKATQESFVEKFGNNRPISNISSAGSEKNKSKISDVIVPKYDLYSPNKDIGEDAGIDLNYREENTLDNYVTKEREVPEKNEGSVVEELSGNICNPEKEISYNIQRYSMSAYQTQIQEISNSISYEQKKDKQSSFFKKDGSGQKDYDTSGCFLNNNALSEKNTLFKRRFTSSIVKKSSSKSKRKN